MSRSALKSDSMRNLTGKVSIVCVSTLPIDEPDGWRSSTATRRFLLRLPPLYFFSDLP